MVAHPSFTLHVGGLDLRVRGRPVTDPAERARVFGEIVPGESLRDWIDGSPLVEIELH